MTHPRATPIEVLLKQKSWERVRQEAARDRRILRQRIKHDTFFDSGTNRTALVLPIHIACAYCAPPDVIEKLCTLYPRGVTIGDSIYNRLPIHVAIMNGSSLQTIATLMKWDGDSIKVPDALGRLPIHYACKELQNGQVNTRYLLKAYPNSTMIPDNEGYCPLHVACRCGSDISIIRMLIRASPKVLMIKTKKGSTPLDCAKRVDGMDDVVGILERCLEEQLS